MILMKLILFRGIVEAYNPLFYNAIRRDITYNIVVHVAPGAITVMQSRAAAATDGIVDPAMLCSRICMNMSQIDLGDVVFSHQTGKEF